MMSYNQKFNKIFTFSAKLVNNILFQGNQYHLGQLTLLGDSGKKII